MASRNAGTLHTLRKRHALGPAEANAEAALPDRRRSGPSCVSWRMDLDIAFQQRPHERGRGADRSGRSRAGSSRWRGCMESPACDRTVGRRSIPFGACRAAVRSRTPSRLPERARFRAVVGAPSLGRGSDRPLALDRLSPDPAWRAAPRRTSGAHLSGTRPNASLPPCTRRWTIQRSSSGSAFSISRPPASVKPRDVSAGPNWRLGSCSLRIRRSVPSWRAVRRLLSPPHEVRRGAPWKPALIARSNRSTRRVSSIVAAATGIPSSPRISWRRQPS